MPSRIEHERMQDFVNLLRNPATGYVSGQSLAKKAGISRSAVWKQIRKLRICGYVIESLHGKGYRLASETEYPVPWELARMVDTSFIGKGNIVYRQKADSTQRIAISLAEKKNVQGAVVIAEHQTSGRGRMKRKWLSPSGGIWISVLLRPTIPTAVSTMLPFVAALAVCDTIRESTGLNATLKWPNDVMVSGKKTAGILLDISAEAETVNYAVIGIGINANFESSKLNIEREDRPAVTSLRDELGHDVNRLDLTRILLEKLEGYYLVLENGGYAKIVQEWRKRSNMLGKKVSVMQQGKTYSGIAADVNDDGSLLLETTNGTMNIMSGDISISY